MDACQKFILIHFNSLSSLFFFLPNLSFSLTLALIELPSSSLAGSYKFAEGN